MRKVYLTQQEMLKFMKEKRQDSSSPNLRKYYEARQEINDWSRVNELKNQVFRPEPSPVQMITLTEQSMTSESDSVTPSQQLSANS